MFLAFQTSPSVNVRSWVRVLCFGLLVTPMGRSCFAADGPNVARTIYIDSVIDDSLDPLGKQMLAWSIPPDGPQGATPQPIDIIINSPGGIIDSGLQFVNRMETAKANGALLRCWVPGRAMSMAFSILLHCNERYAVKYSLYLFHHARANIQGALSAPDAANLAFDLQGMDAVMLKDLTAHLKGMSAEHLAYFFNTETVHWSTQLEARSPGFFKGIENTYPSLLQIVDKLPGGDKVMRSSQFRKMSIFDLLRGGQGPTPPRSNKLIYIIN